VFETQIIRFITLVYNSSASHLLNPSREPLVSDFLLTCSSESWVWTMFHCN